MRTKLPLMICLLLVTGFVRAADHVAPAEIPQKPKPVEMVPVRSDDPAEGPEFAKVTIVEFSDFQ